MVAHLLQILHKHQSRPFQCFMYNFLSTFKEKWLNKLVNYKILKYNSRQPSSSRNKYKTRAISTTLDSWSSVIGWVGGNVMLSTNPIEVEGALPVVKIVDWQVMSPMNDLHMKGGLLFKELEEKYILNKLYYIYISYIFILSFINYKINNRQNTYINFTYIQSN